MRLAVNIDHIATIREARKSDEPDPVAAAALCELAGAQGITVHLRGDRRHIQDRDAEILARTVSTHLNVEMAASPEMVRVAQTVKPHQVTLVPERRDELTTEGGLDVLLHSSNTGKFAEAFGRRVSWSAELEKVTTAAKAARKMGLGVLAGHGLNYRNIDSIAALTDVEELNIGHSIVARAALVGLERAVREMVALMAGR